MRVGRLRFVKSWVVSLLYFVWSESGHRQTSTCRSRADCRYICGTMRRISTASWGERVYLNVTQDTHVHSPQSISDSYTPTRVRPAVCLLRWALLHLCPPITATIRPNPSAVLISGG